MTDAKIELLPNRRKTRLSDVDQFDRTLGHAMDCFGLADFDYVYIGVLRESTRLFNKGDFVAVTLSNGGGERWPVYSVTSKGYRVHRFYLKFQTWHWPSNGNMPRRIPRRADILYDATGQFIKLSSLLSDWSIDPTRQREIVGMLRAAVVERQ